MVVTKIEIQKRNKEKVNIYVDDKYSFSLTLNGLVESGLKEKVNISEEEINALKIKDEPKLAVQQALNILSYSMKTESELVRKLTEKGFSEKAINYAVEKLKGYKYLDDSVYVSMYITTRAIPNNWGDQKIISNLLQKGVDINLIKEKINELYSYDEKKKKQKLYRYLTSKGYSYDLISSTISSIFDDDID